MILDNLSEWRKFRKEALLDNKFTCQSCGKMYGYELHLHHILPVNLFPDLVFDETNVIALCDKCHKEYHKKYGVKENCNHETLTDYLELKNSLYQFNKDNIGLEYLVFKSNITKKEFINLLKYTSKKSGGENRLYDSLLDFWEKHECVTSELIDYYYNHIKNTYDYGPSSHSLFQIIIESSKPFLLKNIGDNSILGVYYSIQFDFPVLIVDNIRKTQYISQKTINDLKMGKYEFVFLEDLSKFNQIREYQFDEKYQNSLFLELWERELKSFTRD